MLRPRRSFLYVPATNERALEKVRSLPCDGIIFDLEDAILPEEKAAARESLRKAFKAGGYGARELLIRINRFDTRWTVDDRKLVAELNPDGVVLPKVESADEVRAAERELYNVGIGPDVRLWAMLETPQGVLRAEAIAGASPRLAGLIMGTNDLARELRVELTPDRTALLFSLSRCVLAARAHGLAVLDGVYGKIHDTEGFYAACEQGKMLGFDGKTLIHPSHIEPSNRAFAPQPAAVLHAEKIIKAWKEQEHKGVITVDGQMIEALHIAAAEQTLAIRDAIVIREGLK